MNFPAIKAALKTLVATLTGAALVQFENEPRKAYHGVIVLLSWVSGVGVGIDENRWDIDENIDAPDPNATPIIHGLRTLALQVSAEVHDQRTVSEDARGMLEHLRTRIRRAASLAALKAVNIGLIDCGNVLQSDYKVDGHVVSRCLIELRFNAVEFDRDTDGATSTIETVEVTSHAANTAGDEYADPPLNYTDAVFP